MVLGDDSTLWIGMTKCNQGERFHNNQPFGCMTMYNTSSSKVVLLEPYVGDATGIAAVTGLHGDTRPDTGRSRDARQR